MLGKLQVFIMHPIVCLMFLISFDRCSKINRQVFSILMTRDRLDIWDQEMTVHGKLELQIC